MKTNTRDTVRELVKWVVSHPIPITWRSSTAMPSGAGRKGKKRGNTGYDLVSRGVYEPGDDPRSIDWHATAQTGGQTVCTVFYREPRDVKMYCLVDTGMTMEFGSFRTIKRHLAGELTGSIIKSADETGDRVGIIAYSEKAVERYLPARSAKVMLFPALASVVEGSAIERAARRGGDTKDGATGLMKALKAVSGQSRSLVFIISDFLNLTDEEKTLLKRTAVKHDVVCICVQDLRERELPSGFGVYTFQDLLTGERRSIWLSKANRAKFAENFQRHQTALFEFFRSAHVDWTVVSTEEGVAAYPKLMRLFAGHRR